MREEIFRDDKHVYYRTPTNGNLYLYHKGIIAGSKVWKIQRISSTDIIEKLLKMI